jgi:hypothetical protein
LVASSNGSSKIVAKGASQGAGNVFPLLLRRTGDFESDNGCEWHGSAQCLCGVWVGFAARHRGVQSAKAVLAAKAIAEGNCPMETAHVSALQNKHAGLERKIQEEMKTAHPNLGMVATLKRHKLRIRDAIARH